MQCNVIAASNPFAHELVSVNGNPDNHKGSNPGTTAFSALIHMIPSIVGNCALWNNFTFIFPFSQTHPSSLFRLCPGVETRKEVRHLLSELLLRDVGGVSPPRVHLQTASARRHHPLQQKTGSPGGPGR